MVPPIHLGAWSMALMLWLPFELLLLGREHRNRVLAAIRGGDVGCGHESVKVARR